MILVTEMNTNITFITQNYKDFHPIYKIYHKDKQQTKKSPKALQVISATKH